MAFLDLFPAWVRKLFKRVEPYEHTISRVLVLGEERRDLGDVSLEVAQAEAAEAFPPDTTYDVQSIVHYMDGSPPQVVAYHYRTPPKDPDEKPRCLGRQPARRDKRTLQLPRYLDRCKLPVPPDSVAWGREVARWGMFYNDRAGCCTLSALGHAVQSWTSEAQSQTATVADTDILAAYHDVGGWPARDEGAVELDVLKYARATGIGGHKIAAYAAVDWRDPWLVRQAIYLFGGLYAGFGLPLSAQRQQGLWSVTDPRLQGGSQPGSWGGHAIYVVGYDPEGLDIITWGERQRITWSWFLDYCEELWVVLSPDWISRATQRAPVGVDIDGLLADLRAVTG